VDCLRIVTDLITAIGTLVLAAVAVFQESIRSCFYHPTLQISIGTRAPDCFAVPIRTPGGTFANSVYLRLWIENTGNATAENAEVYAERLRVRRVDNEWELVGTFPPMNLKWAYFGNMYFPRIAPRMGKHCDLGHITDPARRAVVDEDAPRLALTDQQTSLAFDLIASPNDRSHIVGPGEYRLDIVVAAGNARPVRRTIAISLRGPWYDDEARMLRDGVGVSVLKKETDKAPESPSAEGQKSQKCFVRASRTD